MSRQVTYAARRCALQALYQFDIGGTADATLVDAAIAGVDEPDAEAAAPDDRALGLDLAALAWEFRDEADAAVRPFTPEWPTHRQPAVDRNIMRLAYCEMSTRGVPANVAINAAVRLAQEFGGERSAGFVNAVLDGIRKAKGWPSSAGESTAETA
jgi:N utilization substance protein B